MGVLSLYTEQGIHTDEFCFVMEHGKAKKKFFQMRRRATR